MRKTIFVAVTLLAATFYATATEQGSAVNAQAGISAATPTYAALFPRWRGRRDYNRKATAAAASAPKPA